MKGLDSCAAEREDRSETSRCFVPELLIAQLKLVGSQGIKPSSISIYGVCLLVDISGFTKLSGDFCVQGKNGIDGLQLATNGYMGLLVETIYSHGGDIIKFAGDAIICIFPTTLTTKVVVTPHGGMLRRSESQCETESLRRVFEVSVSAASPDSFVFNSGKDSSKRYEETDVRPELVLRAMECADRLRSIETDKLTVHVAVSCGEMCFGILGGYEDRWECLISGPCLQDLSSCLDDAPSKCAVMSAGCLEVLSTCMTSERADGTPGFCQAASDQFHQCHLAGYVFSISSLPSGNSVIDSVHPNQRAFGSAQRNQVFREGSPVPHEAQILEQDPKITEMVMQFVPVNIAESLCSGGRLNGMSEIREVTTMFMKWDSYDSSVLHKDLVSLQSCFYEAQKLLNSTGAYLRQFLVDDKGCVLIACWGVPSHSYPDNAQRALTAASSIHNILPQLGMDCSFGITTGDVYCGTVGSALRMEYAAIGSVVNMSARLMGKAHGSILLDEATFARLPIDLHHRLVKLQPMFVKGHAAAVQVYEHITRDQMLSAASDMSAVELLAVHPACKAPFQVLLKRLQSPAQRCSTQRNLSMQSIMPDEVPRKLQVLLIEGPRDSGRKASTSWLAKSAMDFKIPTVHVKLTHKSALSSYFVLYGIFCQCAPRDLYSNAASQRHFVKALLREMYPDDLEMAYNVAFPTLAAVFALTCDIQGEPSNSSVSYLRTTSPFERRVRSNNRVTANMAHEVLCTLMRHLLSERTLLVIIDDIQLADDKCLRVLVDVLHCPCKSALVLSGCTPLCETNDNARAVARRSTPFATSTVFVNSEWHTVVRSEVIACMNSTNHFENHISTPLSAHYNISRAGVTNNVAIQLNLLSEIEIAQLLSVTLGTRIVSPFLVNTVVTVSGGEYYLVKEILHCIHEKGVASFLDTVVLTAESTHQRAPGGSVDQTSSNSREAHFRQLHTSHSACNTVSAQRNSPRCGFESTMQVQVDPAVNTHKLDHLVVCRYENLHHAARQILRFASILGPSFSRQVLYGVLPRALKSETSDCLAVLVQQQWLHPMPYRPDFYVFQSNYTHRILYEITPESERRHMHLTIATYLEELSAGDLHEAAQLAHHFGKCNADKALFYTYQAAVRILLQQRASFELCDCLDLLFVAVDFCRTVYDVETLLRVGSDVTTKTLHYQQADDAKKKLVALKPQWPWSMLFLCAPLGQSNRHRHLCAVRPMQLETDPFAYLDALPEDVNISRMKERSITVRNSHTPRHHSVQHSGDDITDNEDRPQYAGWSFKNRVLCNDACEEDNQSSTSLNTVARNYFDEKFQELRALLLQRKREILLQLGNTGKIKNWQAGILG